MSGSVVRVDESEFDFRPTGTAHARSAALCLHGLTGTPYEVRPVAEALAAKGIRARGIWMAGHGGTVDELAETPGSAWVDRARRELSRLREEHDRVYLVGLSMGGLVSLRLAQTEEVAAAVVIATPLVLAPPVPQLLPVVRLFWKARPKKSSGIEDPAARARHPLFPAMPLASVGELIALQKQVIPELPEIHVPILIAHGEKDRVARPRDAQRIFSGVGSEEKELVLLPRSGHIATVDYDGPQLISEVADFLLAR